MKKTHVFLLSIFLIIVTAVTTYFYTSSMQFTSGDKILITKENYNSLNEMYEKYRNVEELKDYIKTNFYKEVDEQTLMEGVNKGVFSVLGDPYSVFMNKDEFEEFQESTSGKFPGIGVYVTPNPKKGIEVVSPIDDTPAFKAGIKAKDIIVAVEGVKYNYDQLDEAINRIKGEPGTDVTITLYRESTGKEFDVKITRAWIEVKSVKSRMLEDGIGYVRIVSFDLKSASEFKEHMDGLIQQGAKGVILDLRNNPGGSLTECIEIADMLLPKGLIVYTEGRTPANNNKYNSGESMYDVALVTLVDGGSASASEVVTGALKDHKRGVIIGTQTFGKGIVQTYMPYKNGCGHKLTTSEYFTPNGYNIHGIGIEPDIVVKPKEGYGEIKEPKDEDDVQLMRAIEEIKKQLK